MPTEARVENNMALKAVSNAAVSSGVISNGPHIPTPPSSSSSK
jgi:hypothetical protein